MKLYPSLLIFLLVFNVSIGFGQLTGSSWATVKNAGKGELTCVYYQTPGLIFEENGKMQGVCVDIMAEFKNYVSEKHNVTLNFNFDQKIPVFSDFINTVRKSKNIMGVCNTSITTDRKKYLDFSPSYMNNPSVLLSNQNATPLRDFSNMSSTFEGYKAVIIKSSTHEKYLKQIANDYFPNLTIEYANSGREVNAKLRSSDKYFTLIDFTEYFDAVRKKMNVTRHPVPLNELQDQLAFIFPKGTDWALVWEEFLTPEFKASVTYKKIIADNLGTAFVNLIR